MNDKKGWGATVLGWFVVSDDEEGVVAEGAGAGGDASGEPAGEMPQVFLKDPPVALGGQVDFKAVFEAAGIDEEQAGRVARAQELLASLPGETPAAVRKQIVEASLTAFGVSIDKIIEGGVAEIQALEGYIRTGAADTQTLLAESAARIKKFHRTSARHGTVTGHGPAGAGAAGRDEGLQRAEAGHPADPGILRSGGGCAGRAGRLDAPGRGRGPGRA